MAPSSRMDSPTPRTPRSDRARPPELPKFWTPHGVPGALVGQTLLGRYVVEAPIGQGGMAHVFRGRDKKLRGPVAIKVLRHLDPEAKRRFAAEVELLFNLVHPNVVHVLDRGDTPDGAPFTVLEHIAGEDLHTRLLKHGPLPWRDAVTEPCSGARLSPAWMFAGVLPGKCERMVFECTSGDGTWALARVADCRLRPMETPVWQLPPMKRLFATNAPEPTS